MAGDDTDLAVVDVILCHGSASSDVGARANILSIEERARAERFHNKKDRTNFIAAHVLLRESLERHLGLSTVNLITAALGKPSIDPVHGLSDFHFSLSHSGDEAVVAICRGYQVGVDIEKRRENFDTAGLAEASMTQQEANLIFSTPKPVHEAFLEFWTAKEAILKAAGLGLSVRPQCLELERTAIGTLRLASSTDERIPSDGWQVLPIRTETLIGAVAVQGASLRLRLATF